MFSAGVYSQNFSFGSVESECMAHEPRQGLVYNTFVNDDNVNVRSIPSLKGDKVDKLQKGAKVKIIGVSREKEFIDQYDGYWLNISIDGEKSLGWMFSKYVDCNNVFTSEIHIESVRRDEWGINKLQGYYYLGTNRVDVSIMTGEENNNHYYTFYWDCSSENYHYSNIPGCYIWYPKTKELKHITYLGGEMSSWGYSLWVSLTEDYRYLIEDFGTAPLPREVKVWDLITNQLIFTGSYDAINLRNHTIEVVFVYISYYKTWSDEVLQLDDEVLQYARRYFKNNKPSSEILDNAVSCGNGIALIIRCELNLDTRKLKPINGEYIRTM